MISYSAALRRILAHPLKLAVESCPLDQAAGRVLARDFAAPESLPRHTYSALDGFAVRAADLEAASARNPVQLRIIGESRPGKPYRGPRIRSGQAVSLATGATIPPGVDAIAAVEWTQYSAPDRVSISRAPRPGDAFRRKGADIAKGAVLFPRGTLLSPAAVAVIGQFGVECLRVFRKPRVAVLTSGDELVTIGHRVHGDGVVATNLYFICERLAAWGCEVQNLGIARDRLSEVHSRLRKALTWGNVVVTLAGVSAGKRDFILPALERFRARTLLHGVAIKPGKPTLFALAEKTPVFGLPGNPLSAACVAEILLKPYIRKSFGSATAAEEIEARLAAPASPDPRRITFLFARIEWIPGGPVVHPPTRQESGNLTLLASATALAILPPGTAPVEAGTPVKVRPLT